MSQYSLDFLLDRIYNEDTQKQIKKEKVNVTLPTVTRCNKKTCITNYKTICNNIKRLPEDVQKFFEVELQTSTSIDGNGNIILVGDYGEGSIKKVFKNYIDKHVFCQQCKNLNTELIKKGKLTYMKCLVCFSEKTINKN